MIVYEQVTADESLVKELIRMSKEWQDENSCYGYVANQKEEFDGKTIFVAREDEKILAYLFGHHRREEQMASVMEKGSFCFEVDELYVLPAFRNRGIGSALFEYAQSRLRDISFITLSTATKDYKAILHFYIEELGMTFHSARLFKKAG